MNNLLAEYQLTNDIPSDYLRELSGMFNQQTSPPPISQVNVPQETSGYEQPANTSDYESFAPETYDYGGVPQIDEQILSELIKQIAPSLNAVPSATPNNQVLYGGKTLAGAFVNGKFKISQGYGANKQSSLYKKLGGHEGVDVATPSGTLVNAPFNGVVELVGNPKTTPDWSNYGNWVRVRDLNTGDVYDLAHLGQIDVKPGSTVKVGQVIGKTGNTGRSTGPHLHISRWVNGQRVNPMS